MQVIAKGFETFDVNGSGAVILQKWSDGANHNLIVECYNCKAWVNREVSHSNGAVTSKDFTVCESCAHTFCKEIFANIYKTNVGFFEQAADTEFVKEALSELIEGKKKAQKAPKQVAPILTRQERLNALADEYKTQGKATKRKEIEGVRVTGAKALAVTQFYSNLTDLEQMDYDAKSLQILLDAVK